MSECKVFTRGVGEEETLHVDNGYGEFGLGLQMPANKIQNVPTLATMAPLLPMEEIRKIVESAEFEFGREMFDTSWITNQNGYGSCAAYGGSSALAKARVINGQDRVDLSGDYLYSLVNGGRDRGSMLDENMQVMLKNGVCTKETVGLGGVYRNKYNTQVADTEAKRFRGHELYAVPDEQSMATALAMRIPVVIAIHVTRSWRSFDSDDVLAECNGSGNHCEHLDDIKWDTKRGCFLYRKATSHGQQYSGDGYCWTLWADHYRTTSRYHQFYAVPSAIDDPEGNNPPGPEGGDHDSTPEPGPRPPRRVAIHMESRAGCGWCEKWKREVMPQVREAGWEVTADENAGGSVPRFRLNVGDQQRSQTGFWSWGDLSQSVESMK